MEYKPEAQEHRPGLTSYSKVNGMVSTSGTEDGRRPVVPDKTQVNNLMRIVSAASDDRSSIVNSATTPLRLLPQLQRPSKVDILVQKVSGR